MNAQMNNTQGNAQGNVKTMKLVYTVVERGPNSKSYWTRIGAGFINSDGSMNLRLDCVPINGVIQVRDWEPQADYERRRAAETEAARLRGRSESSPADSLI
jgi:hypothetical protein